VIGQYWNVTLTSVMLGALFDAYLQIRGGDNTFVGIVESVRGVAAMVCAFPQGWLGDRLGKALLLRYNIFFGTAGLVLLLVGIPLDNLLVMIVGSVVYSIHNQCISGLLPATLSDRIEDSDGRTRVLSHLQSAQSFGWATGPIVQLILLATIGGASAWSTTRLHLPLCLGAIFFLFYVPELWRGLSFASASAAVPFNVSLAPFPGDVTGDADAESESRDRASDAPGAPPAEPVAKESTSDAAQAPDAELGAQDVAGAVDPERETEHSTSYKAAVSDAHTDDQRNLTQDGTATLTSRHRWLMAALVELSSFMTAFGSGMTFKYWPLFFKEDFQFSPSRVCLMQLSIWIAIGSSAQLAPKLARKWGRLPVALLSHMSGTALLFIISIRSLGVYAEVPLVLLRNALMNANTPLLTATILDLVPKEHRGKWGSLASLRRVSWSGTALLGGFLSDAHDFRYAFFITASIHTCAEVPLLVVTIWELLQRKRAPARAHVESS